MTLALGIIALLPLYLIEWKTSGVLSAQLNQKTDVLCQVLASYAFTMVGFLATVITFLFGLSSNRYFQSYTKHGYLNVFLFLYFLTIVSLFAVFVLSIAILYTKNAIIPLLAGTCVSIVLIASISLVGIMIVRRAQKTIE